VLAVNAFHAGSIVVDSSLTIGGHVVTRGQPAGISVISTAPLGSNGTVSISGNDAAGTVGVNVGAGPSGKGCIARVNFRNAYSTTPHVVITPMGDVGEFYIRNKTGSGFDICAGQFAGAGGYTFDYIVEQ
jgi:hypothetical protein